MSGRSRSTIALIPARGGSKGVPGKNLAVLGGKPLIAWTVEAARRAAAIDEIFVSTDDQAIGEAARAFGARFDALRPANLAGDSTPMLDVVQHVVDELNLSDEAIVVLLQPTSPFRSHEDIDAAVELFVKSGAQSLVSMTPSASHPEWALKSDENGRISYFIAKREEGHRRQDLAPAFQPNGALYIARAKLIREGIGWYGPDAIGYVMPRERSLDIDEPWDLLLARAIADSGVGLDDVRN
jgi:N-acylneuraminate cytidylyltransferase